MTTIDRSVTTPFDPVARVLDVVARVVLPVAEDPDVLPLYVDGAHTPEPQTDEDTPTLTLPSDQHPDQVLSRRSYRIPAGSRTSFATYFNAFPSSYWRRFTSVREVTLRVLTTGPGTLVVYRSSARGAVARVTSRRLDGVSTQHLDLPLGSFVDGGWYWFDLVAGTDALVLDSAEWCVAGTGEGPAPRITVGITTFDRPASCAALLSQLGRAGELDDLLDTVLVVDQGRQLVTDDPGFDDAHESLGHRLRVIRQPNLGGSGGFSRAMLETLDAGRSDHVLLLDDDVVAEPEGVARAVAFARHTQPADRGGRAHVLDARTLGAARLSPRWCGPGSSAGRRPHRRSTTTTWLAGTCAPPRGCTAGSTPTTPAGGCASSRCRCCATSGCRCRSSSSGTTPSSACAPPGPGTPRCRCPVPPSGTCRGPTRTTASTGRRTSTPATGSWRPWCTRATTAAAGWSARASRSRSSTCWRCSTRPPHCGCERSRTCSPARATSTRASGPGSARCAPCAPSTMTPGCARMPPTSPPCDPPGRASRTRRRPGPRAA